MATLQVACAANRSHVQHSAAMLHSVLVHSDSTPVHVHYLHAPDLPERLRVELAGMVEQLGGAISFYEIDRSRTSGLTPFASFARPQFAQDHYEVTWYRIFLAELLPDVERVLYLDVDAIVMDSLTELWQTNLAGMYVAAVSNVLPLGEVSRLTSLGLSRPQCYFNAGVLLLNLEQWRRDDCTRAMLECARERGPHLEWPDQDALNIVLEERRVPLHPRWNCMSSFFGFSWSVEVFGEAALVEARRCPGIRHFEGPPRGKPWHILCDVPMREQYFIHRHQTPWPRCRREGITAMNLAKLGAHKLGIHRPVSMPPRSHQSGLA